MTTPRFVAAEATLKLALVTSTSPLEVNLSVTGPVPETASPLNVTTPLTALTVVAPESVPPPVAIETVTVLFAVATLVPAASRISSTGWVVNAEPLIAPAGGVVSAIDAIVCVALSRIG